MLTCSNCGASVRESARFCTSCGTRLNDPVAPDATGVWAAPVANDPDPAGDDSTEADTASPSGGALESDEPATARDDDAETRTDATPASDEGFTWSWGASPAADARDEPEATDQVDEESGVVLEDADTTEPETESSDVVDATEIDILEPDETETDATPVDEPAPETGDTMFVVEEDDGDGEANSESETLAAWAEQWESPEPEDDSAMIGSNPDPEGGKTAEASSATDDVEADSNPDRPRDDDEEDTVTKAERLIGELRAMIPSLVRPAPPVSRIAPDASSVADELEGAARSGQFDDIREALLSAREHPRDVDTMINLTGKIDRLLELLDDRDNLARTAESAATRLRSPGEPTIM